MERTTLALFPSGVLLEPLGDAAVEALLLARSLREIQDEEARAAGFSLLRVPGPHDLPAGPLLVAPDNILFTRELLRAVLEASRCQDGTLQPGRLALRRGALTRFLEPLQNLPEAPPLCEGQEDGLLHHRLWLLDGVRTPTDQWPTHPLIVTPGEEVFRFPVQKALTPTGELLLPFTPIVFLELDHWVHVLRGNLVALLAGAARALRGSRWGLFRLILRARSFNRHRLLAAASTIGRGCDVHPTAVVEGSILADGAVVGAHAVVRFSVVGPGARVGDGAQLLASVLGAGASVSRTSVAVASVLYPGANCGTPGLQLSLLGTDAMLGSMALLADARLEGNVRVRCRGELRDAGSQLLGCCLGHGALVAYGARLAAGRAVPNGCRVMGGPDDVITDLPADLPPGRLFFVRRGKLVDAAAAEAALTDGRGAPSSPPSSPGGGAAPS